ncbi:phenylalanine--tRNA ligase beta subunit-related protein, partial [Staphylococcus capitis]|uniref:phenylalanine--tRNA ligase beta subunit-related protein n=1 Tax=Staphylococcus capitis TaxID=29388 RepID=UPI0037096134
MQIKQTNSNERMTTLDNPQPHLLHSHILITNPNHPIPLPRVIPPHFSQLTHQTPNLVIQPPIFHPLSIPHTSRPLNLTSQSST